MRHATLFLLFCLVNPVLAEPPELRLPLKANSVRFGIIGDSGTGGKAQYDIAAEMVEFRGRFPFDFVLMLGDNICGGRSPADFKRKFEDPYRSLLDAA